MPSLPWLTAQAHRRPDAVALEVDGAPLSYAELHARAARAAAALDVAPGARVALALPAGLDFAVWLHACLLAGAAAMPVDPRLGEAERAAILAGAAAVANGPPPAPGVTRQAAVVDGPPAADGRAWREADVALVVHTSGTTSAPKPVALTYGNVHANALGSAVALGLDRGERWLCPLPLSHVGGLMVLLRSVIYGTTAILQPPPFDAARTAAALRAATLASLVPTMLARALDAGLEAPPRLRAVLLGGGPADPALLARARAARVPVAQTYGLSEACSQVTVSEPGEPETAGWPLPGTELWLEPDGEICVAGPTVAGGGVLRTGDLGELDARGRLRVVGRRADTIVTGGENVAPVQVEAVLLAHPAVAEAGVFGRPDPEWGEALVARVVLRAPVDPEELLAFCRRRLAGHQVPKAVEVADAPLPRTASGKLLRRSLAHG
jgi:O-succinylbenzoic acid--CoA ligase